MQDKLDALISRQEIYEVVARYCRGVDRGDIDLLRSVYHEDATDDHGMFKGRGLDFAEWIVDWERENIRQCQHFIGNFSCDIQGDKAFTETYCISFSEDMSGQNATVYNRYIDRFERRNGEWKIADRVVVLDLTRIDPPSTPFGDVPGWNFSWGVRDRTDPPTGAKTGATMTDRSFSGRAVIVTGAARGQGREIALQFAALGADVAICDVGQPAMATVDYPLASTAELDAVAEAIRALGGRALAQVCDIRDQAQIEAFVQAAKNAFGRVDVLVNNAGILSGNKPVHEMSDDQFLTMIDVNLVGVWRVTRAVVPHLIAAGGGRIVNVASAAGLVGAPGFGHYCAAKHGVVGLTKTMAAELAPYKITVNAICPGLVDTKMVEHSAEQLASQLGITEDAAYDAFLTVHHIKERITPAQSAAAVLYLASEAARVVTGACLPVDAGWTAT